MASVGAEFLADDIVALEITKPARFNFRCPQIRIKQVDSCM